MKKRYYIIYWFKWDIPILQVDGTVLYKTKKTFLPERVDLIKATSADEAFTKTFDIDRDIYQEYDHNSIEGSGILKYPKVVLVLVMLTVKSLLWPKAKNWV
jgi:hypothetical protein